MDEPLPSVRIDIDTTSTLVAPEVPGRAPKGEGQGSGRSIGLVVAIGLALGVIALLVLSLRPNDGETAAGTQRQPTTTVTTTTTGVSADSGLGEGGRSDENSTILQGVDLVEIDAEQIDPYETSIVSDELGYWMLAADFRGGGGLYRSLDGLVWNEVEWSDGGPDTIVSAESLYEPARFYSQLVSTDSGFAMLREAFGADTGDSTGIARLRSTDGITWEVEASYPDASESVGQASWFAVHSDKVLAYITNSDGFAPTTTNPSYGELFASTLVSEVELPESICYVDPFGVQLSVFPCENESSVELTAEDFVDVEVFRAVTGCARAINEIGAGFNIPTGRVVHVFADEIRNEFESSAITIGAQALSDGTIVAIDPGQAEIPAACSEFLTGSSARESAIELWYPNGGIERASLPDGIEVVGLNAGPPPFVSVDNDEIYVAFGTDVWHFDRTTRRWDQRVDFMLDDEFSFRPIAVANGVAAVAGDDGNVLVGDLATGDIESLPFRESRLRESRFSSYDDFIIHVDGSYIFIAGSEGTMYRVSLPGASES